MVSNLWKDCSINPKRKNYIQSIIRRWSIVIEQNIKIERKAQCKHQASNILTIQVEDKPTVELQGSCAAG